ncbi:MAG: His-Xaa-Ser system protein HxsD [Deltaproteobacteria bacterium]|nr:His-Xaa-Ser system protein HxsD [Deltaproteobacteria bacterium]
MKSKIQVAKNLVSFQVDERIFPRPVVIGAAYMFIDRCYVQLARAPKKFVEVSLKGKKKVSKQRLDLLKGEFENELLHQLIRVQVAEKTDSLREVIVGRALLSAEPVMEEAGAESESDQELDYLDDPLGIAVPWEEKYGDDKED